MQGNYCAIDFETARHDKASTCAVGVVRIRRGKTTRSFFSLIRPPEGMEILPFFTGIHGITKEGVLGAPTFSEIWPLLGAFIGSDTLAAHNAAFDSGVLASCLSYYGIITESRPFVCTFHVARDCWPDLPNHRLDTVCDHLGIDLVHHDALSDAMACARIYIEASHV